jgi:Fe2+ or Zn2+ uptake regulation protein
VALNRSKQNEFERVLEERLAKGGLRFTAQRRAVYDVLRQTCDHPTVEEVFLRTKRALPDISHATVYNCLDALVACGLARRIQLEHCHYFCDECGAVFDVALNTESTSVPQPKGFKVDHYDIAVHGVCASCTAKQKK